MSPVPFMESPVHAGIYCSFRQVHDNYKRWHGLEGHGTYELSREVECMSRRLWTFFRMFPTLHYKCERLAEELRDMATELQVGPSRRLYYTMPKPRHLHYYPR